MNNEEQNEQLVNNNEDGVNNSITENRPPKKKKKLWLIMIIVIALIGGVIGGYFVFIKDNDSNNDLEEENPNGENKDEDQPEISNTDYYTIKFEEPIILSNNTIDKIIVKKGSKLVLPTPTKERYIFEGWTYNDNLITEINEVNKDMLIKANWKKEDYPVVEYNFDKIEECNDETCSQINYIRRYTNSSEPEKKIQVTYNDEFINIKIEIDDLYESKILVNNHEISDKGYSYGVRVFKFNELYVIDSIRVGSMDDQKTFILNRKGEVLKILYSNNANFILLPNQYLRVSFYSEQNQIITNQDESQAVYQVVGNTLELIDSNFYNNKIFIYNDNGYFYVSKVPNENAIACYECISDNCKSYAIKENEILLHDEGYYVYNYKEDIKKLIAEKNVNGDLSYIVKEYIDFYDKDEDVHYIYEKTEDDYKIKWSSKEYKFIKFADEYAVVVDNDKLKILNLQEKIICEFDYLPKAYAFYNINNVNNIINIKGYDFENNEKITYSYNLNTKEKQIKKGN